MKMNAYVAPTASAEIAMPSTNACGFLNMSSRSLKVPGSDSSALQQRYFSMSPRGRKEPFLPIEKPAPPRPLNPDASIWAISSSESIEPNAVSIAE